MTPSGKIGIPGTGETALGRRVPEPRVNFQGGTPFWMPEEWL